MKISLKWLKKYVEIPNDLEIKKLVHDLTMSTVEVEDYIELNKQFEKMVVGIIKEVLPHPNADKLKICKTDIGNEIKEIVCGGINVKENMKVAVALPESKVRWHGEGELVKLEIAKVRGIESYGMICASTEIGLGELFPLNNEAEILDLSEFAVNAGTPLIDVIGDDVILEIDNKSLTNRPDLWGHYGIAREISAIYNLPFKEIEPINIKTDNKLNIKIDNNELCPRYVGVKINNVFVKPSNFEIKKSLWSVGLRPINAIVDITNYIMLSVGQPTHAFDSDQIKGDITIRCAKDGEKLTLLDEKELSLKTDNLVIADSTEPIALAGVMGGKKDSILPDTKNVILEIANFNAMNIRHTASVFASRTESAIRYEKGLDPERCDVALSIAIENFKEIYPEMSIVSYCDNYPKQNTRNEIKVSLSWLEKRLGKSIPNNEIESILIRLGFKVTFEKDIINIVVPSWRSTGDISIEEDILEEIARIHGYENFKSTKITTTFESAINQTKENIERNIKEYLAFRCGMQEIFTYPWVEETYLNATNQNKENMLSLISPPSIEERYLRSSHIPNLCKVVSENLRYLNEFSLFESAQVFFNEDYSDKYDKSELLPKQQKYISGALVDNQKNLESLFRKTKGIIEDLPRYNHLESLELKQVEKPSWSDDTIWLNIYIGNTKVGDLGLLSKKSALKCDIKNSIVMLFELNVDLLSPLPSRTNEFTPLNEYPMIDFDLSLLIDSSITWNDIKTTIIEHKNDILQGIDYIGIYKGEQVPENKKSLTIRLVLGSKNKTLTSIEIDEYIQELLNLLQEKYKAELRQ